MRKEILKRTLRFPIAPANEAGNGRKETVQLDSALIKSGFKLSIELFERLSKMHPVNVISYAEEIIPAVKELVGGHVRHNTYFKDFPYNVPDTESFWVGLIIDTLMDPKEAGNIQLQLSFGFVNLLDLKGYGEYQHTYEDMLAVHEELIPSLKDRVTLIHLGDSLKEETLNLYYQLATSTVPLKNEDIGLLKELAAICIDDAQPEKISIRENKAIINSERIKEEGKKINLLIDTPTDIIRTYSALSGGDITLTTPTKFKSLPRKMRRILLKELNKVAKDTTKLEDIPKYREEWKRIGEKLHPYELKVPYAQDVFSLARGENKVQTTEANIEKAFNDNELEKAVSLLSKRPGVLFRNLDRVLRKISKTENFNFIKTLELIEDSSKSVSGRVLLSVRQHLTNRLNNNSNRVFVNKKGSIYTTSENRESINPDYIHLVNSKIDEELYRRKNNTLIIEEDMKEAAIPITEKNIPEGFSVYPRGSKIKIDTEILRFFCYWREQMISTDLDLSAIILDENFNKLYHISYTNLKGIGAVHSGDITSAASGASEFIDINLDEVVDFKGKYIIPMIFRYSGESFTGTEESFFGFMERSEDQKGAPFEERTVRNKSDLFGDQSVSIPLAFIYDEGWYAKWLNIYSGRISKFNNVERYDSVIPNLVKSCIEYEYLNLEYLSGIYKGPEEILVTKEKPEELNPNQKIVTLQNLSTLIPK